MKGRFMVDVYYYTALPQGGEGRGVGRERKTFPFPFLFFAYTEATQGVESFVSLLAAAEETGEVVVALKC